MFEKVSNQVNIVRKRYIAGFGLCYPIHALTATTVQVVAWQNRRYGCLVIVWQQTLLMYKTKTNLRLSWKTVLVMSSN